MDCNPQQSAFRNIIDIDVQNCGRLKHSVYNPPDTTIAFLQHQQVIGADKCHRSRLAQTTDEFRDPEVGID